MTFSRRQKKLIALIADIVALLCTAAVSFLIRFEGSIPEQHLWQLALFAPLSVIVTISLLTLFGIYRFSLSFVSISELIAIIKATGASTVVLAGILFLLRDTGIITGFPRSVVFLNFVLTFLSVSGLRVGKRILSETRWYGFKNGIRVLVIGAGGAGEELARSLKKNKTRVIVGFVDDAEQKHRTSLHGVPVVGSRKDLPKLVELYAPQEIIIAMPSAPSAIIRETVTLCQEAGIEKIKIIPSLKEVFEGKFTLANVRDVAIEDLLGRTPVSIDTSIVSGFLKGKRVLVTGAAGSIGSTLCEQILAYHPSELIAFDKSETPLFYLERRLLKNAPHTSLSIEIGTMTDEARIKELFSCHNPHIVFHAAAYKHVPLMERHPLEAIKNNVFGTHIVAQTAANNGAETFVLVSSDKAVNPSSVMGATKRVCEMICLALNRVSATNFCAVRFGNVLDSQGNVIEIFRSQIQKGGPVEITHPDMKRYFMITAEACLLVMESGAITKGGEIFVLDMGEPVKIIDLAHALIRLSGYTPDVDIHVVTVGMRPGEKLFEELMTDFEIPTAYEKLFIAQNRREDFADILSEYLPRLEQTIIQKQSSKARELLRALVLLVSNQ